MKDGQSMSALGYIRRQLVPLLRYLEMTNAEHTRRDEPALRRKFEEDCASLVGNALIPAKHFKVALDKRIIEKLPLG